MNSTKRSRTFVTLHPSDPTARHTLHAYRSRGGNAVIYYRQQVVRQRTQGENVVSPFRGLDPEELAAVGAEVTDPALRALEVAIYVEEALDVVLPDRLLADPRLGAPDLVAALLDGIAQDR